MKSKWIPVSEVDLSDLERRYLLEVFDSGWISGSGSFVKNFESKFSAFCNTRYAVSCANGTVALHLALLSLGVGPGDEVIVPSLTYISTANAVTYCGAKPVFADCDIDTWNISRKTIEPLITDATKAIIVVHLYGNPVDIDPIRDMAKTRDLYIIEDAAEAHGAKYKGRSVGSLGDIATFSFYANKIITTGEGGMVVTNNDQYADRARLLRGQGMDPDRRYWFPIVGYNYRLTNLQCAIGLAQLERIEGFIDTRKKLAAIYKQEVKKLKALKSQHQQPGAESAWWMYSVVLPNPHLRDTVSLALQQSGIETRPMFYPLHLLPPYKHPAVECPNATKTGLSGLSLPTGNHVTQQQAKTILRIIEKTLNQD